MRPTLSRLILSTAMLCGVASAFARASTSGQPSAPPAADQIDVLFHPLTLRIGLVIPFVGKPPSYPGNNPGGGDPGGGDPGGGDPGGGDPGGGDPGGGDPGDDDDPPDSGDPPTHHQPEPATLISALVGAGTLSWYGWRKRRRP